MTACGKTHYLLNMLERDYKGHIYELACAHDEVEKILQDIVHLAKNTNSLIILDDCTACKDVKNRTSES